MKYLIVAHYKENLDWLEEVPSDWVKIVVTKGEQIPNEGREASSYFWAIHELYPDIKNDDEFIFVQGNPFDHFPKTVLLDKMSQTVYGLEPLGTVFTSLGDGRPHHIGLPVDNCYEKWLGKEWPGEVDFVVGAQFAVKGKRIKKHPRIFYQAMIKEMSIGEAPWTMERMWLELFKK